LRKLQQGLLAGQSLAKDRADGRALAPWERKVKAGPKAGPIHVQLTSVWRWFRQAPSAVLSREQAEVELIPLRWVLLAAATLYLLVSGMVERAFLGWIALTVGVAANGFLVYRRQQRPVALLASIALHAADVGAVLLYTAALQGGMARHLPWYTAMLIVATIRFGRGGIAVSAIMGIVLAVVVHVARPAHASTLAATIGTIVADAALLGYLAFQSHRQHVQDQAHTAELEQRVSEITVLHDVSSAAHDLKSEDALQNIVEIVTRLMGFQRAALYLTERAGEMIPRRYHSYRRAAQRAGLQPLSIEPSLFEAVLKTKRPVVIDGSQGSRDGGIEAALQIAVPLHSEQGPIGVLIADSNDRRATSRSDMKMLSSLAKSAAVAIENASLHRRVERMANHDGVTELYNHRHFQERLREMLQPPNGCGVVSLVMIEIDKFKQYNDSFGHRQGDRALYSLSRALEQSTASMGGIVARYGGDEFVAILPHLGGIEALRMTQQIRDQVYEIVTDLLARENLPPLMLSIGLATYPDDAQSAGELIEAADQAMYAVKRDGGNRIHAYSESRIPSTRRLN
jgi:diguanylate cyclase (GGDEF)-like protein